MVVVEEQPGGRTGWKPSRLARTTSVEVLTLVVVCVIAGGGGRATAHFDSPARRTHKCQKRNKGHPQAVGPSPPPLRPGGPLGCGYSTMHT